MKNSSLLKVCVMAMLCLFVCGIQPSNAQVQTPRYVSMGAHTGGYYEYLPQGYNPSGTETYPFLLFIHGLGETGNGSSSQLSKVLANGPPKLINNKTFPTSFTVNGQTFRFIVISPQFSAWPKNEDVDGVINYVVSHYKVDPKRVYITGLSMGGGATWEYGGCSSNFTYVQKTAAIAPVCGAVGPSPYRARTIATYHLPVWAFHNSGDPTAPVSYTVDNVNLINTQVPAPNPAAIKTIFQANGHDAWTRAYDPNYRENGKNMYEWMLQYQRPNAGGGTTNTPPTVTAGPDKTLVLPANMIQLSGSATDANGSISKYAWSKVSGPATYTFSNAALAATTVSGLIAGTYVFRLTATDNQGATASDDVSVIVNNAGTTPPPATGGKSININLFGGSNPYNNSQWNNWNSSASRTSAALKYTDGSQSTVKGVLSNQTGVSDNGATFTSTMCPSEVIRYASYGTIARTLTITGLNNSLKYNLEFYASRSGITGNKTRFTVAGTNVEVVTDNNKANKASFTSVTPVNGQIVVTLTNISKFNYLNGFKVTESSSASARSAGEASLQAFPSTTTDRFVLKTNTSLTGKMEVQIVDAQGKVNKTITVNKTAAGSTQAYISIAELKAGEYTLHAKLGEWSQSTTISKQ